MKTFIVPIDFSDTSKNAALYAVQLATGVEDARIILLNVFDEIFAGEDGTPLYNDVEARKKIALWGLDNMRNSLPGNANVKIDCDAEAGTVVKNMNGYAQRHNADLIVMGITGSSGLDQIMIGSTTINVVHNVKTPVMIIPPDASYKGINNIAITSDFKDVAATTPFDAIKSLLRLFDAKLHIVNVDKEHYVELSEEYKRERVVLEERFAEYKPEFYFLRAHDFMDGIDRFVIDKNMDVLITIPKKHTFLENVFRTRHTKKLAYHLHIPIMAVHV